MIGLDIGAGLDIFLFAGWSSSVAREAHNLEVVGSNPAPAIFEKTVGTPDGFFVNSSVSPKSNA
jgi:hypothetical protein